MTLAEDVLLAGCEAPDRLAMSIVGLSRADRWSHARLREAVMGAPAACDRPADQCGTPEEVIAWLAAGHAPAALPRVELTPQDRVMLPHGSAPTFLPLALAAWSRGAAIIVPNDKITAAQWPLLGSRHGATVLAAPAAHLQALLAQEWKPWPGLRLALATDIAPEGLRAAWHERGATPLEKLDLQPGGLATQAQTGQ